METERQIEEVMTDFDMDRLAAMTTLGLHPGWSFSGSDVVSVRHMTDEQLQAIGLGHGLRDVIATRRSPRAGTVETKTGDD